MAEGRPRGQTFHGVAGERKQAATALPFLPPRLRAFCLVPARTVVIPVSGLI